ncbi:MAG: DUF4430 domain-containing protein [Firmicutes bacterium]|jgi:hypothetical protein|nr:DUF4430 domain-containing protein [Bacillota bacterium]
MKKTIITFLAALLILLTAACADDAETVNQTIANPVPLSMEIQIEFDDASGDGYISLPATDFTAEEGLSVLEATQLFCMSHDISISTDAKGTYITEIGGLSEKDYTETTGWLYEVNGESPSVGANEKKIEENDKILWKFVDFSTVSW